MKHKDFPVYVILILTVVLLMACRKDTNETAVTVAPVIDSIFPTSGTKGTIVTIFGSGFGNDPSLITILLNGKVNAVLDASDTELKFAIPPKAGTGLVAVDVNDKSVSGPLFNFIYTITVSTYSGVPGVAGFADGTPGSALYNSPRGLTIDAIGNLYVADELNHRIRRVSPGGDVVTFVGSGIAGYQDGLPGAAQFNSPYDVAIDEINGFFYVADKLNHCIRRISATGTVTTAAGIPGSPGYVDAPGLSARLNEPTGLALEGEFINLYIADGGNHCIRKFDHYEVLSTFAGSDTDGLLDGVGPGARFSKPYDIAWDSTGYLFVTDTDNHNIRRIEKNTGEVITIAGAGISGYNDGNGFNALFNLPSGIAAINREAVICDGGNHRIRAVNSNGNVTTLAGDGTAAHLDGPGTQSRFSNPGGMVRDPSGDYFISDTQNHCIRKMVVD